MNKLITTKLTGSIYTVDNFLSDETCNYFIDNIENSHLAKWTEALYNPPEDDYWVDTILRPEAAPNKKVIEAMESETSRLLEMTKNIYDVKIPLYRDSMFLNRWLKGKSQDPHRDNEGDENPDGSVDLTPWVKYTAIAYLSDNYIGGEIMFPDYDINHKPKKGQAIFFANELHGVKEVIDGTRYTLITWFAYDNSVDKMFRYSIKSGYDRLEMEDK